MVLSRCQAFFRPLLGISKLKNTAPAVKSTICWSFRGHFGPLWLQKALENTAPADKSSQTRLGNTAPVHKSTFTQFGRPSKTPRLPTNPSFESALTSLGRSEAPCKNTAPADKSNICKNARRPFRPPGLEKALENTAPADKSTVHRLENTAPVHKSTLRQFRRHSKTLHLPTNPSFEAASRSPGRLEVPFENTAPVDKSDISNATSRQFSWKSFENTAPVHKSELRGHFAGPLGLETPRPAHQNAQNELSGVTFAHIRGQPTKMLDMSSLGSLLPISAASPRKCSK